MRVVVIAVDVAAVAAVAFQPLHGEVEAAQAAGFVGLFDAAEGRFGGGVLLMLGDEARRLHEHAAGAAGGVEDSAVTPCKGLMISASSLTMLAGV